MTKIAFAFSKEVTSEDIKRIRKKLSLTQAGFALSTKTVERWEAETKPITGPVVTLIKLLNEYPQIRRDYEIPPKSEPMRLWYMLSSLGNTMHKG